MVDNVDQNVGRLVEKLKSIGEFENTLIYSLSIMVRVMSDPVVLLKSQCEWGTLVPLRPSVRVEQTRPIAHFGSGRFKVRGWYMSL